MILPLFKITNYKQTKNICVKKIDYDKPSIHYL